MLVQADDAAAHSPLGGEIEAALAQAIEAKIAVEAVIAGSEAQAAGLWALREHIPDAQKREGPNIKHDIGVPIARIPAFLARAQSALDAAFPGVRYVVFGHLGDGNLHYNLSAPPGAAAAAFIEHDSQGQPRSSTTSSTELGGSFSAEHGIGQMKRDAMVRYKAPIELELMRRIKRALDPHATLNPGKVV